MRPLLVLGAATIVAAFGLSGCAQATQAPAGATSSASAAAAPADPGPLPPPEAVADVLARLADTAVPGVEKIALLQDGLSPDAAALDSFAAALRDGGFAPVTVTARDLRWSPAAPGDVLATITVASAKSPAGTTAAPAEFSYPLEFHPGPAGWQLTRDSAQTLLAFGQVP